MDSKPSDLFLGVIEIFGILIPGGLFVFLNQDLLVDIFSFSQIQLSGSAGWIAFFSAAFILGHFLMGVSLLFNKIALKLLSRETKDYYEKIKSEVTVPVDKMRDKIEEVYYAAFSYIRLYSASAIIELERQTAEFKLFRSLALLFLLDIPISIYNETYDRLLIDIVMIGFSSWRFDFLFDWSYRLAFDFFLQIKKSGVAKGSSES